MLKYLSKISVIQELNGCSLTGLAFLLVPPSQLSLHNAGSVPKRKGCVNPVDFSLKPVVGEMQQVHYKGERGCQR